MAGSARIAGYLIPLAVLGAAAGCAPIPVQSNPHAFEVPLDAPLKFRDGPTIELVNAYRVPTKGKIFLGTPNWEVDLQQFTGSAIVLLGQEMRKAGASVGSARKSIVVRVHSVQAGPGMWLVSSRVVLDAEYGDGTKSSVAAEDAAANASRAIDGALVIAVSKLLVDERFQAFVNAR